MTIPAALLLALPACAATSSSEAAATFARLATSSRSARSPVATKAPGGWRSDMTSTPRGLNRTACEEVPRFQQRPASMDAGQALGATALTAPIVLIASILYQWDLIELDLFVV